MRWYRFKLCKHGPAFRYKHVDGVFALSQDVALAFFLDRNSVDDGWHYTTERCCTLTEDKDAERLFKLRTHEIEVDEFVEWMSQPAYQGAKR